VLGYQDPFQNPRPVENHADAISPPDRFGATNVTNGILRHILYILGPDWIIGEALRRRTALDHREQVGSAPLDVITPTSPFSLG
jgi:hypothetical protein